MLLEGKRAIVTGSASGIAAAVLERFVREGADVVSFDIDEAGEQVAELASKEGPGSAIFKRVDLRNREETFAAVDWAVGQLGGLDNFTMCAGIVITKEPEDFTDEDIRDEFAIHAFGTIQANQAVFPHLKKTQGSITNTASYAAVEGWPGCAAYGAAKGAVAGWSRTCARDWAKHNIRVNMVNPLAFTPIMEQFSQGYTEAEMAEVENWMMQHVAMKRFGTVEECAGAYTFLASDLAAFCTGQLIGVDGGLTVTR
ncbi:hypothetical protein A5712_27865 [Mycobacterium sp. E2327]|uniref:SDR family NAD(P)-dependent oxidoreductase n=1 Tax=Mycobacterium sp. E2327 TaxID=1834132 RepID=UPI0007FD9C0D|nr:SDR family oxidoreductase [Mycobacterium sp. E2327]OBI15768.1 hypothetical protein A5712_27865 [Mycobacterium sp. E2327]